MRNNYNRVGGAPSNPHHGNHPLAQGAFTRMNVKTCDKDEVKTVLARHCLSFREAEKSLFNCVYDNLAFNRLLIGENDEGALVLVKTNTQEARATTPEEILNLCKRWNRMAQSRAEGFQLAVLEEESEELDILSELVRASQPVHHREESPSESSNMPPMMQGFVYKPEVRAGHSAVVEEAEPSNEKEELLPLEGLEDEPIEDENSYSKAMDIYNRMAAISRKAADALDDVDAAF